MNFPKINIPVRTKNPWFWVYIGSAVLSAIGISPEMFVSWESVCNAIVDLVKNPYALGCVAITILGIFVDHTTYGIGDSAQAMTYPKPKKDSE